MIFQKIFHHIFLRCTEDIAVQVTKEGINSLEFTTRKGHCFMAVRFWSGDVIQRVELSQHTLASAYPGNFLGAVARLLSFISAGPNLVSVSGCPSTILQTLEQCGLFKHAVQFPFRFDVMTLPRLMHQKYEGFFGQIDFFSQLKYLVIFLKGSLDQVWMLECPNLSNLPFS